MYSLNLDQSIIIAGTGFTTLDVLLFGNQPWQVQYRAGGTSGNVLSILAFLGFKSIPLIRLGNDLAADILVSDLKSTGVVCDYIQREHKANTSRVIEFVPNGVGLNHKFAFTCPLCKTKLPKRSEPSYEYALNVINNTKPAFFFFDRVGPNIVRLAQNAASHGALIMFEPDSIRRGKYYDKAIEISDIIKCSRQKTGTALDWVLEIGSSKPQLFVETLDGEGLRYTTKSDKLGLSVWKYQKPFPPPFSIDRAGAGDWCSAGFIARLLSNRASRRFQDRTIARALKFGQALAAASLLFNGPRGYLERASSKSILKAALSTIRRGSVPNWIVSDKRILEEPGLPEGDNHCPVCLRPLPPVSGVSK